MQFNAITLGSLLALSGFAASQVVVTITSTVTYTPPTTSTVTKIVTVTKESTTYTSTSVSKTTHTWGGWPPGGGITTIYTTIYPSTTTQAPDPNATKCPAPLYYQCGGNGWKGCDRCERGSVCQSQNDFYYQCVAPTTSSKKE